MVVFRIDDGVVRFPLASAVAASDISDLPISASGYRHFTMVPINVIGSSARKLGKTKVVQVIVNSIVMIG
jgi:hypothetical protein